MKRVIILSLSLLLAACGSPAMYQEQCSLRFDTFPEIYACTKDKLYNAPTPTTGLTNVNRQAADTAEIVAFGELLSSRLRQGIITDDQAKSLFAQKIDAVKAQH